MKLYNSTALAGVEQKIKEKIVVHLSLIWKVKNENTC